MFTYVNYPSTEYLDLPFLDFLCFNVYLEAPERLEAYLARLQVMAGDAPLVMGELGLDAVRHGEGAQSESLQWQIRTAFDAGCAGAFVYSWTDEWHRGGEDVEDWGFGLTRRDRTPKPALAAVQQAFADAPFGGAVEWPRISVVVCTYNGGRTIRECLSALEQLDYPDYEVIVVDDGSTDGAGEIARAYRCRVIQTTNQGLSSARNTGLGAATGSIVAYLDDDAYPDAHWLRYLALTFAGTSHAGVGGPNLPPPGDGWIADCVAHSPGNPVHVLLSDREAEHLPGCNMAFRKAALEAVGGFDPQSAYTGGIDFNHEWADRSWSLGGFLSGSYINGRSAVITRAQRSSARYFQRPDADHLSLDPAATALSGWAGRLSLGKEAGEHWRGEATVSTISPGYETNDLGFQTRADRRTAEMSVEYVHEQPGRLFREWSLEASSSAGWNFSGDRLSSHAGLELEVELLNYWQADIELSRAFSALNDRLTRGGPLARDPAATGVAISVESNPRKPWTIELSAERERGAAISATSAGVELDLRPSPSWDLSLSAEWERARSAAQFLDSEEDTLALHTYQQRYIFADLVETEVSLGMRANVTFTPALSLELYARPFAGSGRFGRPKNWSRLAPSSSPAMMTSVRLPKTMTSGSSTPMGTDRLRSSISIARTSPKYRCAATPFCAGNGGRAPRSSSSGSSGANTSANSPIYRSAVPICASAASCSRWAGVVPKTASWSRSATGSAHERPPDRSAR